MIIKHEISTVLMNPKREYFFDLLVQSKNAIEKIKETLSIIQEAREGEIDEYDELDALEAQRLDDMKGIKLFANGGFSAKQSVFACARNLVSHMNVYNNTLNNYVGFGMFLGDNEHEILDKACRTIISELCYVLWFEFDMPEHLSKMSEGEEYVDDVLKMYCDSFGVSLESILNYVKNTREEYPFRLSIFDDYPEYEHDFEALVGGDQMALLANADLTVKQVQDVINGKLAVEDLFEQIKNTSEEELVLLDESETMTLF